MRKMMTTAFTLGASVIVLGATLAQAQEWRPPLRYGYTSGWAYDPRDDRRDLPTNGYFPGNFATDPYAPSASGFFGSRNEHSPRNYPSQVWFPWLTARPPRD